MVTFGSSSFSSLLKVPRSMPERALVREQVRLGEIGILLTSPEQLRNRSVRRRPAGYRALKKEIAQLPREGNEQRSPGRRL